jgi:hypothetical protein
MAGLGQIVAASGGEQSEVTFGLRGGEQVIRGGLLKKPEILTNLIVDSQGRVFVPLTKTGPNAGTLTRFLTGKYRGHPLAKTLVFEKLQSARNTNVQAALQGEVADGPAPVANGEGAALEADGEAREAELDSSPGKLRNKRVLLAAAKPTVKITYPGSDWEVEVQTAVGIKAVNMLLSEHNMQRLFALVVADLRSGEVSRKRHGADTTRPAPRGLPGNRSYAVRSHWVTRIKSADEPGKVRVLKRRRSDQEPKAKVKKLAKASAKKLAAKVVPKPLAKANADDGDDDDPASMFN